VSDHSLYDTLRHLADSWFLVVMFLIFLGLAWWPFRPGAKKHNEDAANSIFKDRTDG
jgi:cytochrome c oxidase cbb3-type subunit 4